jgi:hypothetical protein
VLQAKLTLWLALALTLTLSLGSQAQAQPRANSSVTAPAATVSPARIELVRDPTWSRADDGSLTVELHLSVFDELGQPAAGHVVLAYGHSGGDVFAGSAQEVTDVRGRAQLRVYFPPVLRSLSLELKVALRDFPTVPVIRRSISLRRWFVFDFQAGMTAGGDLVRKPGGGGPLRYNPPSLIPSFGLFRPPSSSPFVIPSFGLFTPPTTYGGSFTGGSGGGLSLLNKRVVGNAQARFDLQLFQSERSTLSLFAAPHFLYAPVDKERKKFGKVAEEAGISLDLFSRLQGEVALSRRTALSSLIGASAQNSKPVKDLLSLAGSTDHLRSSLELRKFLGPKYLFLSATNLHPLSRRSNSDAVRAGESYALSGGLSGVLRPRRWAGAVYYGFTHFGAQSIYRANGKVEQALPAQNDHAVTFLLTKSQSRHLSTSGGVILGGFGRQTYLAGTLSFHVRLIPF